MAPDLPPELMDQILAHAVPPPSRYSGPERVQLLCVLSLVNQHWRTFSQARLFQYMHLSTAKQARALADLFDRGTFDPLQVKTLTLNVPVPDDPGMKKRWKKMMGKETDRDVVLRVAKRMEGVQVLWCSARSVADETDLAGLFKCYKQLRSFRTVKCTWDIFYSVLVAEKTSSPVTSLSFTSDFYSFFTCYGGLPPSLTPPFLHVTHLSLHYNGHSLNGPSSTSFNLDLLAPQLVSLLICTNDIFDPRWCLRNCKKLKTLLLDATLPAPALSTLLGTLPPTLTTLHLVGAYAAVHREGERKWMEYMRGWGTANWEGKLEKLVLWPKRGETLGEEETEEVRKGVLTREQN